VSRSTSVRENPDSDRTFASWPLVIVDVGGGSTEWIVGEGGFLYFTASTLLGTARLLEVNPISDAG